MVANASSSLKQSKKIQQNPLPVDEQGYGKLLRNHNGSSLSGFLKIKLLAAGLRVVYKLQRIGSEMLVIVVGVREDEEVYNIAESRASKHGLFH